MTFQEHFNYLKQFHLMNTTKDAVAELLKVAFCCDCDVIYKHAEYLDERFMYSKDGEIVRTYDENGICSDLLNT